MTVRMPSRSAAGRILPPAELAAFARYWADEVVAGKYHPHIDYDAEQRWHQRIYRDRRVDVWLISWLPTQGTQLHDHGGSSGAFTVLQGELTETVAAHGGLVDHRRTAGSATRFGPRYVHDVRNLGDEPAISVHAYSAPLTAMNFYDLAEGRLERIATLATDDPEAEFDPGVVRQAS
ncbi:cysteine dioxygenase [Jatrophihabitans fulvus]